MKHLNNNIKNKKKQYKHLSESERLKIAQLKTAGFNISEISRKIFRDKSTISREIKRNGILNQPSLNARRQGQQRYRYSAFKAQKIRDNRYKRAKSSKKFNHFIEYSNKNLTIYSTLEDILQNYKKQFSSFTVPCLKSLYNWAYKGIITLGFKMLPIKKQRKKILNTQIIEDKKTIHQRKDDYHFDLNDYTQLGHYEIDTIYNSDRLGGVLTLNERSTRKLYSMQIPNRRAVTVNHCLRKIIAQIGGHNIISITSDNGTEFAYSRVIEKSFNLKWYYCDPYRANQRGQNERLNRDLRRFYPKGTNIVKINQQKFQQTIELINSKPRRIFGGLSANEYAIKNHKFSSLKD